MKDLILGTDICQISRLKKAVEKHGDKFLNKTFTEDEIEYSKRSLKKYYERLAVRFATKEAVSKALEVGINGLGWGKGINWKDVEVVKQNLGSTGIKLSGTAKNIADSQNIQTWKVSVSHMGDYATATVIGIKEFMHP